MQRTLGLVAVLGLAEMKMVRNWTWLVKESYLERERATFIGGAWRRPPARRQPAVSAVFASHLPLTLDSRQGLRLAPLAHHNIGDP